MLYLDDDLSLHDCLDASDSSSVGSCELIKDYKRNSKKTSVGGVVPSTKMRGSEIFYNQDKFHIMLFRSNGIQSKNRSYV